MARIPRDVRTLLESFAEEFSPTVWKRFLSLLTACILVRGRRTICSLIRCLGSDAEGHFSSFHRVFSHRQWSSSALARKMATAIVDHFVPDGVMQLVGDDTVSQHRGEQVYGKGCHRDAVRSSHSHLVHRWGHKWVVLALRVKVPGTDRSWALPMLIALYRTPKESLQRGLRHKTPPELMQGLLALWLRWFPSRKAVFSGDGAFATHKLSQFAARNSSRLTLVSKFVPDAVLHSPPPPRQRGQIGRTRIVGNRLPSPEQVVATTQKRRGLTVQWYGGGRRRVEIVTGVGHWYRQGQGLVKVRWVFVHDLTGHHRDEYFYSTEPGIRAADVIEAFVGRWDIEVTFEEMREHLGLETTRGRVRNTVLRVEPCLFLLHTLTAFWYSKLPTHQSGKITVGWRGKTSITFSDAIAAVRRCLWDVHLFQHPRIRPHVEKLPQSAKNAILDALAFVT
ncbi:MAG: transposase [Planctomycetaceae bacterium]|nr:transposase [Planctomycetaceae bacterium]